MIVKLSHWVTVGSLQVTTGPNLADYTQTRNVIDTNKNRHERTDRNLGENVVGHCKTFTRRFDSDRRLHISSKFNRLQDHNLVAHFRLYHCRVTGTQTDASRER
jgi:hypothetical protein